MKDRDSDRYRSDMEPIEVIFQRIAQKEQLVPRSIERGTSYQAVHEPAPSSTKSPADAGPSIVLNVTTDPHARRDVQPLRRASIAGLAVALLVALVLAARWCSW